MADLTEPTDVWFCILAVESNSLTVGKQGLHVFFEERLIVEAAIPAPPSVGAGERDVLPGICPGDLVALVLHALDKFFLAASVLQHVIDGLDQINFPAIGIETSLILTWFHPFHF